MSRCFHRFPSVTLLALLALLGGCGGHSAGTAAAPSSPGADPPEEPTLIGLQVTELKPQAFTVTLTAPGAVRSNQDTTALVGPLVEGRISAVLVGWGDAVKSGQVLAWLDSAAVGEAKAAHFRAKAELQLAESSVKRLQLLASSKIAAAKDLAAAQADRETAQAELDAAENALHVMGFSDEDVARFPEQHEAASRVPLLAPLAGTIVQRSAELGAWAAPADSLFTIMDLGTLWVDAQVYEKDLGSLKPGQPVTVSVVAWPGRSFTGQVGYIGSTVDEATRTTTVRTVVSNPDGLLKPGMFATVQIVTRSTPGALVLPEGAVLQSPGREQVVVDEGGHYGLRDVQVGVCSGGLVEITGGVKAGERVVTGGQNQIATELAGAAEAH